MTETESLWLEREYRAPRRRALSLRDRVVQKLVGKSHTLQSAILPYAIVVLAGLSVVAPLQAQQTPGDGSPGISDGMLQPADEMFDAILELCPPLAETRLEDSDAVGDLARRCTEVVVEEGAAVQENALLQMTYEELAAQGTNAVEASNKNIGARLAALRAGATGISLQRFSLNIDGQTLPGTLVASLLPYAAVSSAVPARTSNPFNRFGVFATGTVSVGDKDATRREAGFDFDTFGVTGGVDYRFTDNFILGVALGYVSTDADFDDTTVLSTSSGGGVDTKGFSVSVYGTYYIANFHIDGIGTLGWNDYDVDRAIRYSITSLDGETTTVSQTVSGDTDGTQYSFSIGAGYDFTMGSFTIGPLARLDYAKLDIDGYQEEIDNTAPGFGLVLEFDDQDITSLTSVLGAEATYAISTGLGVLLPQVRFEWLHEFENDRRTITARFVNDPNDVPINLTTDSPDRDYFTLGAGLAATFRAGFSAFAYYETRLGLEDVTVHTAAVGVRKDL